MRSKYVPPILHKNTYSHPNLNWPFENSNCVTFDGLFLAKYVCILKNLSRNSELNFWILKLNKSQITGTQNWIKYNF